MAEQLTAAQRAIYFNQNTRHNQQMLNTVAGSENGRIDFTLPKARYLAGLFLMVSAKVTATHATETTYAGHEDSPFKFLSRAEVSLNNGFAPFSISGQALADYNKTIFGVSAMTPATSGNGRVVQGLTASSGGTANTVRFLLALPNMINERDPVGLIMLQNEQTQVNVNITLGALADLAPVASGYTFAISDITVALMTDTFSVPAVENYRPDLSVLKLVQEKTETIVNGENIIHLSTNRTYRKLGMILYSATPARQAPAIITSNIELIANQADIPVRISPLMLTAMNAKQYGGLLQNGSYVFDFSDNGIPNYGTARDYVDTERLTEFWLKFTASAAGTLRVWSETLVRLS